MSSKFSCIILLTFCICISIDSCISQKEGSTIAMGPWGAIGEKCGELGIPLPGTKCRKRCVLPSPVGSCKSGGKCCAVDSVTADIARAMSRWGAIGEKCGEWGIPVPGTKCRKRCVLPSPVGSCKSGGKCCAVDIVHTDIVRAMGPWGAMGEKCGERGIPVPGTYCSESCVLPSPVGSCKSGGKCCAVDIVHTDIVRAMGPWGAMGEKCGERGIPVPGTYCSESCVLPSPVGSCKSEGKCCAVDIVHTDIVPAMGPWGAMGEKCGEWGIPVPGTNCSESCVLPSPVGSCKSGGKCCAVDIVHTDIVPAMGPWGAIGEKCGELGIPLPGTKCRKRCVLPSPVGSCKSGGKCCAVGIVHTDIVRAMGPWGAMGEKCGEWGIPVPGTNCSESCVLPSPVGSCKSGGKCCAEDIVHTDIVRAMGPWGAMGEKCGERGIPVPGTNCSESCVLPSPVGSCKSEGKCCAPI